MLQTPLRYPVLVTRSTPSLLIPGIAADQSSAVRKKSTVFRAKVTTEGVSPWLVVT